jgi:hypothetical protein
MIAICYYFKLGHCKTDIICDCRTDITYNRLNATDDFDPNPPDFYYIESVDSHPEEYDEEEEFVPFLGQKIQPKIKNKKTRYKVNKEPPFIHSWISKALRNSKREPA